MTLYKMLHTPGSPTSGGFFGKTRSNNTKFHSGVDIEASAGAQVLAFEKGTVAYAGDLKAYGKVVYINHPNGIQTRYAHLETHTVKTGDEISKGQNIGTVGNTGNAKNRPPHLHFEIRKIKNNVTGPALANDLSTPQDPLPFLKNFKLKEQPSSIIEKKWKQIQNGLLPKR